MSPDDFKAAADSMNLHLHKSHEKYFEYFLKEPNELAGYLLTLSGCGLSFTPAMHRTITMMGNLQKKTSAHEIVNVVR